MRVNEAIEAGANLPPVKLYKFGDAYFVRDGHHRVSVARFRGSNYVDAVVTELFEPKCA